jgi:hypothetical protein
MFVEVHGSSATRPLPGCAHWLPPSARTLREAEVKSADFTSGRRGRRRRLPSAEVWRPREGRWVRGLSRCTVKAPGPTRDSGLTAPLLGGLAYRRPSIGGEALSSDFVDAVRVEGDVFLDLRHRFERGFISPHRVYGAIPASWDAVVGSVALVGAIGRVFAAHGLM